MKGIPKTSFRTGVEKGHLWTNEQYIETFLGAKIGNALNWFKESSRERALARIIAIKLPLESVSQMIETHASYMGSIVNIIENILGSESAVLKVADHSPP